MPPALMVKAGRLFHPFYPCVPHGLFDSGAQRR